MAMSSNDSAPTYFIYRDTRPGEPFDPTSPPVFFPPKDSDELFDALRAKYPNVKTHSERMRDAIIDFLLEERQNEQLQASPNVPSASTAATSPWQQSWPSVSASTLSSPETIALMTPMPGNSPQWQPQVFPTTGNAAASSSAASTSSSPPGLEQMTSVFSLSSTEQPKQRIRRKMTEAEKAEYRQRRIVKACEKCAKRKRKCHHNQPDLTDLTAKTSKVTKSSNTASKANFEIAPPAKMRREQAYDDLPNTTDPPEIWTTELQSFDEFTTLLDDSDFDMSGLFPLYQSPSEQEWQWQVMEDLPLFDDVNASVQYGTNSQQSDSIEPARLFGDIPQVSTRPMAAAAGSLDNGHSAPSLADSRFDGMLRSPTQQGLFGAATPGDTGTHRNSQSDVLGGRVGSLRVQPGSMEQPLPQHTLHAHEFNGDGAFVDDEQNGGAFARDQSPDKPIHKYTRATTNHTKVPGSSGGRPVGAPRSLSQSSPRSPDGANVAPGISSSRLHSEAASHTSGARSTSNTLTTGSLVTQVRSSGIAPSVSSLSLGGTSLDGVDVPITRPRLTTMRQTIATISRSSTSLLQTRGEPSTPRLRENAPSIPSSLQFSLWSSAHNNSPSEAPTGAGTFLPTSWVPVSSQKSSDNTTVHLYKNQSLVRSFESGLHSLTCARALEYLSERTMLVLVSLLGYLALASVILTLTGARAAVNPSLMLLAILCPLSGAEIAPASSAEPRSPALAKQRLWLDLPLGVASAVL